MARFNLAKYDPANDSSADRKDYATKNSVLALSVTETDGVSSCPCGCGHMPVGKKSKFIMGHDQRLKGMLQRAHVTGTKVVYFVNGKEQSVRTALQVAKDHGFEKYVESAKASADKYIADQKTKAEDRAKATAERQAASAAKKAEKAEAKKVTDANKAKAAAEAKAAKTNGKSDAKAETKTPAAK